MLTLDLIKKTIYHKLFFTRGFFMKYIIFEDFSGQPEPFLFPRRVDHGDMREQMPYTKVLSAGYVEWKEGGLSCYSGSSELEAVAQPHDAEIILARLSGKSVE